MKKVYLYLLVFFSFGGMSCAPSDISHEGRLTLQEQPSLLTGSSVTSSGVPWEPVCEPTQNFCWKHPNRLLENLPLGLTVTRMLPFANNVVWLMIQEGYVLRFDGTKWTQVNLPFIQDGGFYIQSTLAISSEEIWIATNKKVFHCFVEGCSAVSIPTLMTAISGIAGSGAKNDVWIYGGRQVARYGVLANIFVNMDLSDVFLDTEKYAIAGVQSIYTEKDAEKKARILAVTRDNMDMNYDGGAILLNWAFADGSLVSAQDGVKIPKKTLDFSRLPFFGGATDKSVWLVDDTSVYLFDGTKWQKQTGILSNEQTFYAPRVYNNALWLVARLRNGDGVLKKWDGSKWSYDSIAPLPWDNRDYWVSAADELYLINTYTDSLELKKSGPNLGQPLAPVWKQSALGKIDLLWSPAKDETWVFFQTKAVLRHSKGKEITEYTLPAMVNAIWGAKPDDVWFGTTNGAYRFDGQNLHFYKLPQDKKLDSFGIRSIWGASATDVWMVSDACIFHYDGQTLVLLATVKSPAVLSGLTVVHGSHSDDVWFGGTYLLIHWDGQAFVRTDQLINVTSLYSSPSHYLWATDSIGRVFFLRNNKFVELKNEFGSGLWGDGENVWQARDAGIFRWDGTAWKKWVNLMPWGSKSLNWTITGTDEHNMWVYEKNLGYVMYRN